MRPEFHSRARSVEFAFALVNEVSTFDSPEVHNVSAPENAWAVARPRFPYTELGQDMEALGRRVRKRLSLALV